VVTDEQLRQILDVLRTPPAPVVIPPTTQPPSDVSLMAILNILQRCTYVDNKGDTYLRIMFGAST
jgi:hypothetical protein